MNSDLQNLTPEEIEKLQKENNQAIMKGLFFAFNLLIQRILDSKIVRLYLLKGEPLPISATLSLKELSKYIDSEITKTLNACNIIIMKGLEKGWLLGETQSVSEIKASIPENIFKKLTEKGLFAQRKSAFDQFVNRKTNGLKLSQRVWKLNKQVKFEIENTLQLGIVDGRGAAQIARDLTIHLQEPDRLFRRVLDAKTGGLKLSKAAEAYNPGQGVYRSSYKNALRLARNEIGKAYRIAHLERIQSLPFVTGIKISLSNSHSDRVPKGDMCNDLEGIYPKSFKWSSWHVQCMCKVTSVLASDREIGVYLTTYDTSNPNLPPQIKTFPESIKSWSRQNSDRYQPGRVDWIDDNKAILALFK